MFIFFILILLCSNAYANYELSTATNTGIGTASPNATLGVGGSLSVGGATYTQTIPPTNGALIQGNVGIGSLAPGVALDVAGTVRATNLVKNGGTSSQFLKADGSVDSTSYVTTLSPITLASPNVGIGSATPGQVLDVQGTVRMVGFILSTNPTSGYVLTSNSVGVGTWAPATGGGGGSGTVTNVATNSTLTGGPITSTGTLGINLSNANTWTGQQIFNSANVGIGSATPGQALDVQGTTRITQIGTALDVEGTLSNTYFAGNIGIGVKIPTNRIDDAGGEALGTYAGVNTAGTGNLIVSGNVGIGSPSPGQALDTFVNLNGNLYNRIINSNSGSSASAGLLVQNNSGNYGNFSKGSSTYSYKNLGNNDTVIYNSVAAGNISLLNDYSSGNINLSAGGSSTPQMTLQSTGNVGIGSITPGQALDVNGTIRGLSAGACSYLYKCVGGVDAGVIQTSACNLCPAGSCTQMNGCF